MAGMTLKDWLETEDVKQEWLAEKLDMSQSTVSRIISGADTTDSIKRRIYRITEGAVTPNWMVLGRAA